MSSQTYYLWTYSGKIGFRKGPGRTPQTVPWSLSRERDIQTLFAKWEVEEEQRLEKEAERGEISPPKESEDDDTET